MRTFRSAIDNSRSYITRFTQPDTDVPESQGVLGLDRYAYVNNNPVNFNDPTGHSACWDDRAGDPECQGKKATATGLVDINEYNKNSTPVSDWVKNTLPFTPEMYSTASKVLDVTAELMDAYAVGVVTYGGIAGAGIAAPFALGGPEVPVVTGLAGMGITELAVQPIIKTSTFLSGLSALSTYISDTKKGTTEIENLKISSNTANSVTLFAFGAATPEAFLNFISQTITVLNDFGLTSFPFP